MMPTRCTYVSFGPLVLVLLESPSSSLNLSDSRVPIKPMQRLPSPSAVESLGFRHRAALDSAHVSKHQPHKNFMILALQISPVSSNTRRKKIVWRIFRCTCYFCGAHARIPCVESAVNLAGTRWKPGCAEMCRG